MDDILGAVSQSRIDRLLLDALQCCGTPPTVSILEVREQEDDAVLVLPGLDLVKLQRYLERTPVNDDHAAETPAKPCSLRVFFVDGTTGDDGLHVHIDPATMRLLHEKAGLDAKFLAELYGSHDWTIFPTVSSTNFALQSLSVHYGFWIWSLNSTHSFTHLVMDGNTATYFCINFPASLQNHIIETAQSFPSLVARPLTVDVLITDKLLASYHQAVADQRAKLLAIEKENDKSSIEDKTKKLHSLAVKWHTMLKDLGDIQQHIHHLRSLANARGPSRSGLLRSPAASQALQSMESSCHFWSRWVRTYLERTNIRINLMHHLAAQKDNELNQEISNFTIDIALQTQRDSVSMFTLAMVTCAFLPGTFVCSVLSTVFFSYDGSVFAISPWWWILPVVGISTTSLVMYLWFMWYRARLRRDADRLQARRGSLAPGGGDSDAGSSLTS